MIGSTLPNKPRLKLRKYVRATMGMSDTKMIGAMLCFLGTMFYSLGVIWLLDRKLLTIGNILFLTGLTVRNVCTPVPEGRSNL